MKTKGAGVKKKGRSTLRDIVLFVHSARLFLEAQCIRKSILDQTIARLQAKRHLPRHVSPIEAELATLRASPRMARWFAVCDTCLIRSLVLGTLLSDQEGVFLHIGFRQGIAQTEPVEGHAWISFQGEVLLNSGVEDACYKETLSIEMRR